MGIYWLIVWELNIEFPDANHGAGLFTYKTTPKMTQFGRLGTVFYCSGASGND